MRLGSASRRQGLSLPGPEESIAELNLPRNLLCTEVVSRMFDWKLVLQSFKGLGPGTCILRASRPYLTKYTAASRATPPSHVQSGGPQDQPSDVQGTAGSGKHRPSTPVCPPPSLCRCSFRSRIPRAGVVNLLVIVCSHCGWGEVVVLVVKDGLADSEQRWHGGTACALLGCNLHVNLVFDSPRSR